MNNLVFVDTDPHVADSYREVCGDLPGVEVVRGDIFSVGAEVFVSPANSFGFMDGGIDLVYLRRWPWIQKRVQTWIKNACNGELLVGQSFLTGVGEDIDDDEAPMLIVAPTMRVPMVLSSDTVNPYLAARAVFMNSYDPESERIMAIPGMGTGCGGVNPWLAARQVRKAFEEVVLGTSTYPDSWIQAASRHRSLTTGQGSSN